MHSSFSVRKKGRCTPRAHSTHARVRHRISQTRGHVNTYTHIHKTYTYIEYIHIYTYTHLHIRQSLSAQHGTCKHRERRESRHSTCAAVSVKTRVCDVPCFHVRRSVTSPCRTQHVRLLLCLLHRLFPRLFLRVCWNDGYGVLSLWIFVLWGSTHYRHPETWRWHCNDAGSQLCVGKCLLI